MYCPKCGKENVTHAKFCAYCGALLPQENGEGTQGVKPLSDTKTSARQAFRSISLTKSVIITLVGALLTFISVFLPLYSVDILDEKVSCNYFSQNKLATDFDVDRGILGIYTVIGLLFPVFAIVAAIMKLKGSHETARTLSVIAVGLAIAMVAVTKAEVSSTYDYLAQGSGPFLCLVGTIVELTGTIMKN